MIKPGKKSKAIKSSELKSATSSKLSSIHRNTKTLRCCNDKGKRRATVNYGRDKISAHINLNMEKNREQEKYDIKKLKVVLYFVEKATMGS